MASRPSKNSLHGALILPPRSTSRAGRYGSPGEYGARDRLWRRSGGTGSAPVRGRRAPLLHVIDLDGAFAGEALTARGGQAPSSRPFRSRCRSAAVSAIARASIAGSRSGWSASSSAPRRSRPVRQDRRAATRAGSSSASMRAMAAWSRPGWAGCRRRARRDHNAGASRMPALPTAVHRRRSRRAAQGLQRHRDRDAWRRRSSSR